MKINELIINSDYFSNAYSQKSGHYDTDKIINELTKYIENKEYGDDWITSPIKYSNFMNWENIPSETKMNKWINHGEFELKSINPHQLITYQKEVVARNVLLFMKNENMGIGAKRNYERYPIVKQWNGKDYLIDGNHRAVAALWSNRLLECRCLTCDIFFDMEPF